MLLKQSDIIGNINVILITSSHLREGLYHRHLFRKLSISKLVIIWAKFTLILFYHYHYYILRIFSLFAVKFSLTPYFFTPFLLCWRNQPSRPFWYPHLISSMFNYKYSSSCFIDSSQQYKLYFLYASTNVLPAILRFFSERRFPRVSLFVSLYTYLPLVFPISLDGFVAQLTTLIFHKDYLQTQF